MDKNKLFFKHVLLLLMRFFARIHLSLKQSCFINRHQKYCYEQNVLHGTMLHRSTRILSIRRTNSTKKKKHETKCTQVDFSENVNAQSDIPAAVSLFRVSRLTLQVPSFQLLRPAARYGKTEKINSRRVRIQTYYYDDDMCTCVRT